MQGYAGEIRARGAQVVALGQGDAAAAARYCAEWGVDFACLGDPDREGYRSYGLGRGGWWGVVFQPFLTDTTLAVDRIRRADLAASRTPGTDVLQLPGVAIVDRGGIVRFLHRAEKTDDLPPMPVLLSELELLR